MIESIIPFIGIALCSLAVLQLMFWSAQAVSQWSFNKKQFEISREALRKQIDHASSKLDESEDPEGDWTGFREFVVERLNRETELATSVYLRPADGKKIVGFRPGQHLTFKFDIPGESKPVVRCYSLSEGPGYANYRITVKKMFPPRDQPDAPPGCVSTFINTSLMVGDRIQVKSPSGHFFLDEQSNAPVVMLAGGVGITPMASMIDYLTRKNSDRLMILVYGSRNSPDHIFKQHFHNLAERFENFHVINAYSSPVEQDVQGIDFHTEGFVSIDLLKELLPSNQCQFYICGPGPFMEIMYNSLIDWEVPDSRIFFEAFGPASVKRVKQSQSKEKVVQASSRVQFKSLDKAIEWDRSSESLLDLAEENGVEIESGCRAGSCGTCQTALLSGKVKYPEGVTADCEPGHCLVCIAKPDGDVELDA